VVPLDSNDLPSTTNLKWFSWERPAAGGMVAIIAEETAPAAGFLTSYQCLPGNPRIGMQIHSGGGVARMVGHEVSRLDATVPGFLVPRFFFLLQAGFQIRAEVGCSIGELLCGQLGLDSAYVNERISTLFLDGRPVDDLETAMVQDGSVLALSGALPGLVGATLRRGGFYACLRDTISYQPVTEATVAMRAPVTGTITLKLFNLMLPDLGPRFLRAGILVDAAELLDLLGRQPADFWDACPRFVLNGAAIPLEGLRAARGQSLAETVFLRVIPT
jgi:hypothetical protein